MKAHTDVGISCPLSIAHGLYKQVLKSKHDTRTKVLSVLLRSSACILAYEMLGVLLRSSTCILAYEVLGVLLRSSACRARIEVAPGASSKPALMRLEEHTDIRCRRSGPRVLAH